MKAKGVKGWASTTLDIEELETTSIHTFCVSYNQEIAHFKISDADMNKSK